MATDDPFSLCYLLGPATVSPKYPAVRVLIKNIFWIAKVYKQHLGLIRMDSFLCVCHRDVFLKFFPPFFIYHTGFSSCCFSPAVRGSYGQIARVTGGKKPYLWVRKWGIKASSC